MKSQAETPEKYLQELPEDRQEVIQKLRQVILDHLPEGFEETMSYGMLGYVVPLSRYPKGYQCKSGEPLPFINLASQKNYVAFYHMAMYLDDELVIWFKEEYKKHVKTKLDIGKSCVRFKNLKTIPYNLIGELCEKITVDEWIEMHETSVAKAKCKN